MDKIDSWSISNSLDSMGSSNLASIGIDDVLDEIEPAVDGLAKDISGVGQKAAERYLLRYEYGIATNELASEFDVTSQTISNQISGVRTKILKYPRLARIVGTLRAHRAELSQPDFNDGHIGKGNTKLDREQIEYAVEFKTGTPGRPYSWCYRCESRYEQGARVHHLFQDYLVDAIHGVFLKRLLWGFSRKSWNRPPMGHEYKYVVYPLPNVDVPNNRSGSLLDAVEYHWAHETKNKIGPLIGNESQKRDLESLTEHGKTPMKGSAHYAQEDVLSHRIRHCESPLEAIEDYNETVHIRNNIERLLRMYPFDDPFDLPYETVTQLWNSQPNIRSEYNMTRSVEKQALYHLVDSAKCRYRGRDVYLFGKDHRIEMPNWN